MKVEINKIIVKSNFRKQFDLDDLQVSMKERGQLQPILITKDYALVAGERRLRAAIELGWTEIECHMADYDSAESDAQRIADGTFENLKRQSYSKSEEAKALAWLKEHWEKSGVVSTPGGSRKTKNQNGSLKESFAEKASKTTGMSKTVVSRKARLGKAMGRELAAALDNEEILQSQAEELARVKDKSLQARLVEKSKGASLEKTKTLVADALSDSQESGAARTSDEPSPMWLRKLYKNIEAVRELLEIGRKNAVWGQDSSEAKEFFSHIRRLSVQVQSLLMLEESPDDFVDTIESIRVGSSLEPI